MNDWYGCYRGSSKGIIHDEAFSHPAKMPLELTRRIFRLMFERGWLEKGDLVADPFGGIGTTGIIASAYGCPSILVELEQKFVDLAEKSFKLHLDEWEKMDKPTPVIAQGDSRQFSEIVQENIRGIVTSPPFGKALGGGSIVRNGYISPLRPDLPPDWVAKRSYTKDTVGSTEGQLGQLEGETYWQAVVQVYTECLKSLKSNGVMAVVVKPFVRKGKIVDLPKQTEELLEALGFKIVEKACAWLVSEATQKALIPGTEDYKKQHKSFFRRLAERKGSPRIDYETVLFAQKVIDG